MTHSKREAQILNGATADFHKSASARLLRRSEEHTGRGWRLIDLVQGGNKQKFHAARSACTLRIEQRVTSLLCALLFRNARRLKSWE